MTPTEHEPRSMPSDVEGLIERLRSQAQLKIVCPYDKRSPDYWTTPHAPAPCPLCGATEDDDSKCRGAHTSIMEEAASALQASEARIRELETEVLKAAFSDRVDDAGSPLTWKEIADASELARRKAEELLARCVRAADSGHYRDRTELSIAMHPAFDDARALLSTEKGNG